MILAATGHRPPKLGGYGYMAQSDLDLFAHNTLTQRHKHLCLNAVISGLAQGWDQSIARAALNLNIPLIAAIPFPNQPALWPANSILQWRYLRDKATEVHVIAKFYSPEAMQLRNEWMVDRCQHLLALWNGSPGGTANCINYAFRLKAREPSRDLTIRNLWSSYKEQL